MHTPVIPTEGCAEPKNHRNENRLVSVFLTCSSSIYCLPWSRHCLSIEDGTINKLENIHGLMQPNKEMNHSKCLTASEYLLTKAGLPGLETCSIQIRLLVSWYIFPSRETFHHLPSSLYTEPSCMVGSEFYNRVPFSSTPDTQKFLCEPRVVIWNLCAFLPVFSHYIQNTGLKFYLRGKQTYANVTSNNY